MKNDIAGRSDLEALVNSFYDTAKTDPIIGGFFAHVDWSQHLPVMYNFWENAIFYTGTYKGNPLQTHQALHSRSPLNAAHFKQWQDLFIATVDELFSGEKAELIKQRALCISTVMQMKVVG